MFLVCVGLSLRVQMLAPPPSAVNPPHENTLAVKCVTRVGSSPPFFSSTLTAYESGLSVFSFLKNKIKEKSF